MQLANAQSRACANELAFGLRPPKTILGPVPTVTHIAEPLKDADASYRHVDKLSVAHLTMVIAAATIAPTLANDSTSAILNFTPNSISTATMKLM